MNRLAIGTLLLPFCVLAAQTVIPLRDGQQVVLRGALTMEPAGRLQFVTVKTSASYVPMFSETGGRETPGETLHEISLSGYFNYDLLYAHKGQAVTVTGKIATDDATPYFWHGTRLQASSIVTADGIDLRGKERGTWVAADVGLYRAEVTLPADLAAPWRYRLEGTPVTDHYLSCASNGGGDVVNCFCAHGFHPTETKSSLKDRVWQGNVISDMQLAQFSVGEDARRVDLSVTCSR